MKWIMFVSLDEYFLTNDRIEQFLGLPDRYFSGYAKSPIVIDGKYYLPITTIALPCLNIYEINELIDNLPSRLDEES